MSETARASARALAGALLLVAAGCSSAPAATGATDGAQVAASTSAVSTTSSIAPVPGSGTPGKTPAPAAVPVTVGAGAPAVEASTTVATSPAATTPTGPRMLLVELTSHPSGGWCPLVGPLVLLQFSFQAADAVQVVVKNAAGDLVASLPANSSFTLPHVCAAMPVLYRFYPLGSDGTFGPPWNYNV